MVSFLSDNIDKNDKYKFDKYLHISNDLGIVLKKMITNMEKFTNMENITDNSIFYKIHLYSGHELNVAMLMQTIGIYQEGHVPEFTSSVILELHNLNNKFYVKVKLKLQTYFDKKLGTW